MSDEQIHTGMEMNQQDDGEEMDQMLQQELDQQQ